MPRKLQSTRYAQSYRFRYLIPSYGKSFNMRTFPRIGLFGLSLLIAIPAPFALQAKTIEMKCGGDPWTWEYTLHEPFLGAPSVSELFFSWPNERDWCSGGTLTIEDLQAKCVSVDTYTFPTEPAQLVFVPDPSGSPNFSFGSPIEPSVPFPTGEVVTIVGNDECPSSVIDVDPEVEGCNLDEMATYDQMGRKTYDIPLFRTTPTEVMGLLPNSNSISGNVTVTEISQRRLDFKRQRFGWYSFDLLVLLPNEDVVELSFPGTAPALYRLCDD